MNVFTDQSTKTLTSTKALVVLGVTALVVGGGFVFALVRLPATDPNGDNVAPPPIVLSSCQSITTSGNYILQQNLTSPINNTCFSIKANNVTLNGNNKTITVSGDAYAVDVWDPADNEGNYKNWHDITVKYLKSNGGVRAFGDGIARVTFDHLNVSSIANWGSDDTLIANNTVGEGGISITNSDTRTWHPYRPKVTNNVVTGGSLDVKVLFEIIGGTCGSLVNSYCPAPAPGCPRIDAYVVGNSFTSTRNDPPPEGTAAVRIRCATHTKFLNNTVRSTGTTLGLYLRDEMDNSVFQYNTVVTNSSAALWIAAGNTDKTFPSGNIFNHNTFRTNNSFAFYALGIGSGNRFTDNIFYDNNVGYSGIGTDNLGRIAGYFGNTFNHNTFYSAAAPGKIFALEGSHSPVGTYDTFTNNIFSYHTAPVANPVDGQNTSMFGYDGWQPSRWSNNSNHNLFYNRGGALSFGSYGSSLGAWRTTTAADGNSISANPLLTNPAAGDFSLQTGSPARNAASDGTNIGARR